jgi:lipopolysaccharide/colanic/teichoic acid biosynthesis glycosyltransferase
MMEAKTHVPQSWTPRAWDSLRLPMRISERRLLLTMLDLAALNGALLAALAIRPACGFDIGFVVRHSLWFLLLNGIWFPVAWVFDAYDVHIAEGLAVLKAWLATTVAYLLIRLPRRPPPSSFWQLFAFPVLALGLVTMGRILYALVLGQPMFQRRALIVGAGWAGRTIAEALAENGNGTYQVVGFVDDDPEKVGTRVEIGECRGENGEGGERNGQARKQGDKGRGRTLPPHPLSHSSDFAVLGDWHALPELVERCQASTVILAIPDKVNGRLLEILTRCVAHGVDILPMPVLYEDLTGRVPVEHAGENWYAAMLLQPPSCGSLWPVVKRTFDIVSAGVGAVCLAVALPFIALAICLDSRGPVFYSQERVGKGGKRFWVYKFRSMVLDAEKKGEAVWAEEEDPRATRVGRLLRKMHVDEFPQFLNILKGEMSTVGPRPERPEFVEELAEEIPFYRMRHAVRPGMAGWGLVKQGYGSSAKDALIKLQYDLYYVKHQSLWLDIGILLKTILDTVTFGGR